MYLKILLVPFIFLLLFLKDKKLLFPVKIVDEEYEFVAKEAVHRI